jgi:hypothetical protein
MMVGWDYRASQISMGELGDAASEQLNLAQQRLTKPGFLRDQRSTNAGYIFGCLVFFQDAYGARFYQINMIPRYVILSSP